MLSSSIAGKQRHSDHEDAQSFGSHDRPLGAVQHLLIGAVLIFTKHAGGNHLRSGGTGGKTGSHKEGRKHSLIDQREADQRADQEARVCADRQRKHKRDPLKAAAMVVKPTDKAVKEPDLEAVANRNQREDAHQRDVDNKRNNAQAHHGGEVVVHQDPPEPQRIGQVSNQADHTENDGHGADQRRGLQDRSVLRGLLLIKVEHDGNGHRAARNTCQKQVHGNRPRPADALRQTKCKVHGDIHLYTPFFTMGM